MRAGGCGRGREGLRPGSRPVDPPSRGRSTLPRRREGDRCAKAGSCSRVPAGGSVCEVDSSDNTPAASPAVTQHDSQ